MPQVLFLLWLAVLTACSQTVPVKRTPTPGLTPPPPTEPAELSQAGLAARIVESAADDSTGNAQSLIGIYQAAFGAIDPESAAFLAELADHLAAGGPEAAELAEAWLAQVLTEIEARESLYMNISPQAGEVASNRVEAFIQAHDFVDAFVSADEDKRFSHPALADLAQLSANAEASLANTGDPPLIEFSRQIDQIMRHAARGEWPQAREALADLKRNLPRRPGPVSMSLRAGRGSIGVFSLYIPPRAFSKPLDFK